MASKKRDRSPSERSLLSLSDTAIKTSRKAEQAAIKTVKSITALIKKPHKAHVIPDSERESFLLM